METENAVVVKYGDCEISYDERSDKWRFELRGRERSSDSLAKAKEAIDKEAKEKKAFVRTPAYLSDWNGSSFRIVDVTSIAEPAPYSSAVMVWVSDNGNRSKKDAKNLYAKTPANDSLIAEIRALDKQIEAIEKQRAELKNRLETIKIDEAPQKG